MQRSGVVGGDDDRLVLKIDHRAALREHLPGPRKAEFVEPADAGPLAAQHLGLALEGHRIDVMVPIQGRLQCPPGYARHHTTSRVSARSVSRSPTLSVCIGLDKMAGSGMADSRHIGRDNG